MRVLTTDAYYRELAAGFAGARRRIVLAAMLVVEGGKITPLLEALLAAQRKGIRVTVLLDRFSFMSLAYGTLIATPRLKSRFARTKLLLHELEAAGGSVSIVGKNGINPYAGRMHAKVTIIDDTVYSFGGINIADHAFDAADYMLRSTIPGLADRLEQLVAHIAGHSSVNHSEHILDRRTSWLFDSGKRGDSLIYARACELARQARHVYYVSQMYPSGELGILLKATDCRAYYNRPGLVSPMDKLALALDSKLLPLPNHYHGQRYLHAKCILYELKDGSKALLSGSHNFSWRGVRFGTQEIALYSTDEVLWRNLYGFIGHEAMR